MNSIESRDVVKRYEVHHNPMLLSILSGGVMESLELKQPCETLLVPRHVSLEVTHMTPFFLAAIRPPVTAPPISALFGERPETPEQNATCSPPSGRGGGGSPASSGLKVLPENASAFQAALQRFFEHHLLHFEGHGNSEFINLRGQRGAFAEDLSHVKRFGYVGQVAVLADADPLRPLPGRAASGSRSASAARGFSCHPTSLQIFVIEKPLMDDAELRYVTDLLQKLIIVPVPPPPPAATPVTVDGPLHVVPRVKASFADIPFLMGDRDTSRIGGNGSEVSKPVQAASPAASRHAAGDSQRSDHHSGEVSVAETVVIDDFEDEPNEDPDMDAYVAKYTHISERQRRQTNSPAASADGPGRGGAATENGRNGQEQTVSGGSRTVSMPGTKAVGSVAAKVAAAEPSAAPRVVGAPSPSPSPSPSRSSSDTSGPTANAAGIAVAAVARPVRAGSVHEGSPAIGVAAQAHAPVMHTNVLRHQYSRECIKDYRRVVAADNEIFYSDFEQLMSLKYTSELAKLMSEYVSKNQQMQQPILSNVKYNNFVERCHELVRQTPRLCADPEVTTIMLEGIERYTTARLYRQIFNVSEDERAKNVQLQSKLLRLESMAPSRLEALPEVEYHHVWGQAMFELDGMDFFRSPRDKLRCGMRACELLSLAVGDILRERRNAKNRGRSSAALTAGGGGPVPLAFGADEFLPCFLLLVLRARPLSFVQNVCYIERFRYPTLMSPEESYCFATLQSALMFWQSCTDDAQIRAPSNDRAAAVTGTPSRTGSSANLGPITSTAPAAATATAPTPAAASKTTLTSALAPPTQQPPRMTERDLLPSVRQTSLSSRQQPGADVRSPAVPPASLARAAEEAPTVLDVLFGWANRNLAPIANEIGLRNNTNNGASFGSPPAARRASNNTNGASPKAPGAGSSKQSTPLRGTVVAHDAPVPQAEVVATREATFGDAAMHASAPSAIPPLWMEANASTRARVRELLVTQRKTFEQLSQSELQMIVEEARQLLTDAPS